MNLSDLTARFKWTRDRGDSWRILSAPLDGDGSAEPLEGDCDDFAVTALWITEVCSMWRFWWALLTFRAVIWIVKGKRFASHAVLYHRAHGWIDNQNPTWGESRDKLRYPIIFPVAIAKMALGFFVK